MERREMKYQYDLRQCNCYNQIRKTIRMVKDKTQKYVILTQS